MVAPELELAGALLRGYRLRAGLTQRELAQRAEMSLRALRDIERDRVHRPQSRSIERLTSALGLADPERSLLLSRLGDGDSGAGTWIGVLGPLVLRAGSVEVDLPAPMPRRLLGLLALHPGRTVGCEEIVDVLWGEEPPRSCLNLVHGYIGRLRSLPRPGPGSLARVLARSGAGYRLTLTEDESDLALFEGLARRAEQARGDGDDQAALRLLGEALDCWRGPVLAGADYRLSGHPAAVAVSERRTAVVLAHADLAAGQGQSSLAIGRLRELAAERPLHEGVASRLMLAMADAGDQASALRLFADIRERLGEELGVEPGPELQQAQLRVLRQELPAVVPGAPAASVRTREANPAQLPGDVAAFAGRDAHLRELDGLLGNDEDRPAAVVITAIAGTAGIGKTALAVHWAHRVRDRFPDGQLYANLRGFDPSGSVMAPGEALRGFLSALGLAPERVPDTVEERSGMYRSLLAERRMLVLLDNARDAEQVRPLLPGSPGCLVMVTSRNRLTSLVAGENAHPIALDLLSAGEARALLSRRLGRERVAAEPEAVEEIVERCARLPLALAIAAARARGNPGFALSTIAAELAEAGTDLSVLDGGDPVSDVRAVFSWSYRALSDGAARLFRLLGLHPGPDVSVPAVASLAGLPKREVRGLLVELARVHMVTEHVPGRYTFHDLLRAYAAELAETVDPEDERREAIHRLLDHYLHTACNGDLLVGTASRSPLVLAAPRFGAKPELISETQQALDWFGREYAVLVATIQLSARLHFDTHTWQLAWSIARFCDYQADWQTWISIMRKALDATRRLRDLPAEARILRGLGVACVMSGERQEGYNRLNQAVQLHDELGDPDGRVMTYVNLAVVLWWDGRYREALWHSQRAVGLSEGASLGNQAKALNQLGWCLSFLGENEQAIDPCERAVTLFRRAGDQFGLAEALDSLGRAHQQLGQHDKAVAEHTEAIAVFRKVATRIALVDGLVGRAEALHSLDKDDVAMIAWREALELMDEIGHPDADALRAKLTGLSVRSVEA